jgi:hypothetical protein
MIRPRSLLLLAVAVVSLFACSSPGTGRDHAPALGPYAAARVGITPVLRSDPVLSQDVRNRPMGLHETRQMCDLRGSRGSC